MLNALNALHSYYGLICLSVGYIECIINDVFTEFSFAWTHKATFFPYGIHLMWN